MTDTHCFNLSIDAAALQLRTNLKAGLTLAEIYFRQQEFGPNQLKENGGVGPWTIFIEQFKSYIVLVLIGAVLVSGFLGEWIDASAIIGIIILNSVLGFIQEYRAEKALAALKILSNPTSKVIRDGRHLVIPSAEIVPGDLLELEAGDKIPADGRLVYVSPDFATQEASLTGESLPVTKTIEALERKELPVADRLNMVYMGTAVVSGKCRALVVTIGMQTELGKIAGLIQAVETETTPLQKKLEQFGKFLVYICFILVGLVFLMELWRGGNFVNVFITSVSLAVAAIPEGLPAVVTIALALGVQRMVKRHALIRKLPSVETLGSATYICSDKTGTLTKNEMTVQTIYAGGETFAVSGIGYQPVGEISLNGQKVKPLSSSVVVKTLLAGLLCNGAQLNNNQIIGDPTEGAILTVAAKLGLWKEPLEKEYLFVEELPFDSARKKMTMIRKLGDKYFIYVKGAPEILLSACSRIEEEGGGVLLDGEKRGEIIKANSDMANQAMRVLAIAYKELETMPEKLTHKELERDLTFLGLVGMIDPPRDEVRLAMAQCHEAGISTVMITGDHKNTAVAIAKQLGFYKTESLALSGEELDKLSDEELIIQIKNIPVFARVSPEHKLRIVKALRQRGEIVAMTGDGVNDAPAVKEADIGVAMGITGTDVTKEVADMVITDDNFASIVAAVEEGRGVYDNIKKFIHFLLSCNTGEILVMFAASLIGWPIPLYPVQILWVNLVTDGLPALALGVDPIDQNIMRKPPRPISEGVITGKQAWLMLGQGFFIAFCSLLAFAFVLFVEHEDLGRARTAAFIVLACSQLFHSFNCRNLKVSLLEIGIFTNMKLIYANLLSFILMMLVVYLPFCQTIFKTEPLGVVDWLMVIAISSFPFWAMEGVKLVCRRRAWLSKV